jgi:hypothetical protein
MASIPSNGFRRVFRRTMRIIVRVIIILFFLIIVLLFLLQTSFVQNFGRKKIQAYLESKLHSRVNIGGLSIDFPKKIVLKDLYFEDLHQDTLLSAGKLDLDVNLWGLLKHKVILNQIDLENWTVNVTRVQPDSDFNFAFISKAFSSGQASNPSARDSSGSWTFELGKIHLISIRASYKDDASGIDASLLLSDLQTRISKFDLDRMEFSIPEFQINGLDASLKQYKPLMAEADPPQDSLKKNSITPALSLGKIGLGHVALHYLSEISGIKAFFGFGNLFLQAKTIDLQKSVFDISEFGLKESVARLELAKNIKQPGAKEADPGKTKDAGVSSAVNPWNLRLGKLDLSNNQIQFDDNSREPTKSGVDYHHISIQAFSFKGDSLEISDTHYRGNISQIGFREKSGFTLKKLSTSFAYDDRSAILSNLIIQTNNSILQNQTKASYASVSSLSKTPGNASANILFDRSSVAINDILLLVPSLEPMLKSQKNTNIRLRGKIDGKIKDLRLSDIEIEGFHNTSIQFSGSVKGLPSVKDAVYDIHLKDLYTGAADINSLVPHHQIPSNFKIPDIVMLTGNYEGTVNSFKMDIKLISTLGNATVEGNMNLDEKRYDMKIDLFQFELGKLLKQDSLLGLINLQATAIGKGFDYKTMESDGHVQMTEGTINAYQYRNLLLDISLHRGSFLANSTINDPNIKWDFKGSGNISGNFPSVKLNLDLDTLNFHALHLIHDTLGVKFRLEADFASTNPDSLQGKANISGIEVKYLNQLFQTDSVAFLAEHLDTGEIITLHSEVADLDWRGKYKITEVSDALKQTINHYYALKDYQPVSVSPQQWQLNMVMRPSPLVFAYDPLLRGSDTARLQLLFNSHDHDLHLSLAAPVIHLGKEFINKLAVQAHTDDTTFVYNVALGSADWIGLQLFRTSAIGKVSHNRLQNTLVLNDARNKLRYRISNDFQPSGKGWRMSFVPDSLTLNYNNWIVAKDNFILYDSSGLRINDFRLDYGDESFQIKSKEPNTKSPIDISFVNFRLRTISSFADQDSLAFGGILDGTAEVKDLFGKPMFTSDLRIKDLIYSGDSVGNLIVQVSNKDANTVLANINLKGRGNDADVNGEYSAESGNIDLNVKLNSLNLDLIKAAATDQVRDIKGRLTGNLKATGKPTSPVLNGWLQFDSAYIIPAISGEKLRLPPDKIELDEDGINFSNYALIDSAGNKAIIDGNIFTKDFRDYRFDLSLQAQNFRLVNAPRSPNNLFYGRLIMDADVDLSGDLQSPKMNAVLRVNPKTDFTVTLPSSDPEIVDRQGVVVFVDKAHPRDTVRLSTLLDSLSKHEALKGMDVALTIETDSNAQFTLIIDERNGDALSLRGRADLTGGIDPSGKMTLTGNYELENGAYNVSLSVLKRKFNIVRGSTLTWSGSPTEANLNIRATYLINTPPIDLMQNQLSGANTEETTRYKQKLPFIVTLIMQGELLKPIITFEISLQADKISQWPDVDLKLQQIKTDQAEVNKQVFALLLLNRFVQENPFVSQTPTYDAQTIAMQSVSKILSDQVNQLAASLVKGVDLTVDLNSDKDYTSGAPINQTQLNVGVSKNLFTDRVRVTVGSNFQLGEVNPNQDVSNIAGDVDVDYKLTKDGRYMIRAYRRDQYQSVIEGQVVETGLSFILTFDYNAFYELFSTKKKEEKKIQHPSHKKPKDENPPK